MPDAMDHINGLIVVCLVIIFNGVRSSVPGYGEEVCFPENFMFGVATASYQIEGAWNVSGKSESIWDHYTHRCPRCIFDHTTADVSADSYHQYRADVRLMATLGVKFYRFSISWPRILPTGLSNEVNADGVRYYNELLEELYRHGIWPMVTMYHWDLPQSLQDLGGWTNPLMADYFVDYARVLLQNFSHRVGAWVTFNEPLSFCEGGYGGLEAPARNASGLEDYMCAHTVLRAHGMVYRMFKKEFKKGGSIMGITLDMAWFEAATTSADDKHAAEVARQFTFGWFAHPIFSKTGDYPRVMRQKVDAASKRQRFPRSRLPTFTAEEVDYIRGSADFLGLNHYTTYLVAPRHRPVGPQPSFYEDAGVIITQNEKWPKTNSTWLRVVPWGFRKALNWIRRAYNNPVVIVTENGVSTPRGLRDKRRVSYMEAYLRSLHSAMVQDGCNVVGYTYWSLIDNFEWTRGFSERFGLHEVDYASSDKTRTPRLSASYYERVARTHCLPARDSPRTVTRNNIYTLSHFLNIT